MPSPRAEVWHLVARLTTIRLTTCALLWAAFVTSVALPSLNLPLREVALIGLAAAFCRTLVVLSNRSRGAASSSVLGASLVCDAILLTGLLDITGGPFNPFIVMYAVYVWLAVVTASSRWGLLTGTLSAAGFAWLIFDHLRAEQVPHHRLNDLPTHLFTMWVAMTAIVELVAHYVARADAALREQQRIGQEARERAARSEHRAALMTLAAGAAHELSTPLATIAVAARELERSVHRLPGDSPQVEALRDDARLIRSEVDRCQVVLDAMTGRATSGEPANGAPLTPDAIVALACARLSAAQRDRLQMDVVSRPGLTIASGAETVQAVSVLLKNAFDASQDESAVSLRIVERGTTVRIEVQDSGAGMSAEDLRHVGEPFYTTKEPGRGTGLGLFLARGVVERMSGTLEFEVADGTTAVIEIPVQAVEAPTR